MAEHRVKGQPYGALVLRGRNAWNRYHRVPRSIKAKPGDRISVAYMGSNAMQYAWARVVELEPAEGKINRLLFRLLWRNGDLVMVTTNDVPPEFDQAL